MAAPLYLCVHVRDFAVQALVRLHPELGSQAVAVLSGDPPLERVFGMNREARRLEVMAGMSRVQMESFAVVGMRRDREQEDAAFAELCGCAQSFSPRIECIAWPDEESCGATLMLDVSGCDRLLGGAEKIAGSARQHLAAVGYEANVAAAHNAYVAVLAARGIEGAMAIAGGCEAEVLAPLPLSVLELTDEQAQTFAAWGLHRLGELAALPAKALVARVGQSGLRLQAQARGEYSHLLVPAEEPVDAALCESVELDHPVELMEPLLFLLGKMLAAVTGRAARRALAIASVEIRLVLDGDVNDAARDGEAREHCRCVRPALPERDRQTLLKLIQLDLDLHPPEGAVIALHMVAHPARPQMGQQGLFAAQAPEAGRLEILLARLRKLVGEGRVGVAELIDSHAPEAFRVAAFEIAEAAQARGADRGAENAAKSEGHAQALRMMRPPCAISVELHENGPSVINFEGQRMMVQSRSGPWRSSGSWWTHSDWCREEWDVVVRDVVRAALHSVAQDVLLLCLRLAYEPGAGAWYVIGIYD
jgi:protein ImuB